jgi:hypothetical protein
VVWLTHPEVRQLRRAMMAEMVTCVVFIGWSDFM